MIQKIKNKINYYKLELQTEIGLDKISEFKNASKFRKYVKIVKMIWMIIGLIISFKSVCSLFIPNDDNLTLENYKNGIIYFEDEDMDSAKEFFEKVYSKNKDFLDIKYYYAITSYFLNDFDRSYKILKENRYSLTDDELAFYARYESDRENYDKSREYINKIQKPENLKNPALAQYVVTSLNLAALEDYNVLCNTVYMNTILLNRKINENNNLKENCKINFSDKEVEIEQVKIDKMVDGIIGDAENEIMMLKKYKLYMYMQFTNYAIKFNKDELPVFIFTEASECIDFFEYGDISLKFLGILNYYTVVLDMGSKYPEEIKLALKNIIEKYDVLVEKKRYQKR